MNSGKLHVASTENFIDFETIANWRSMRHFLSKESWIIDSWDTDHMKSNPYFSLS